MAEEVIEGRVIRGLELQVGILDKGDTVIMEGSGGAAFFMIDAGEAKVTVRGVAKATLGPGDYFGELALIDGGPDIMAKPWNNHDLPSA